MGIKKMIPARFPHLFFLSIHTIPRAADANDRLAKSKVKKGAAKTRIEAKKITKKGKER
jgi:predicted metal-dependent phosphoesterase TrpH